MATTTAAALQVGKRFIATELGIKLYGSIMSSSNVEELDLKPSISPPRPVEESPETSCVSTEEDLYKDSCCSSPETTSSPSMVVVGCPRCLIYIMLSEVDPTCPNCRSSVLLHFQELNSNHRNAASKS